MLGTMRSSGMSAAVSGMAGAGYILLGVSHACFLSFAVNRKEDGAVCAILFSYPFCGASSAKYR